MVVMRTDDYNKLTKAISTTNTDASTVASIFLESNVTNNGIQSEFLSGHGPQFVSNFYVAVCGTLGVNKFTTSEDHSQTNARRDVLTLL